MSFTLQSPYERYKKAISHERLPLALVDVDAFEENARRIFAGAREKRVRIATKSLRAPRLIRRAADLGGTHVAGLMTYTARETMALLAEGFRDLLLAYPTVQRAELLEVARANREGTRVSVVADAIEHLEAMDGAAREAGTRIPVIVDVDVAYQPVGALHVGVLRSPLRTPADVVAFGKRIAAYRGLVFEGVMAYEAQVAGLADHDPNAPRLDLARRALKALSRPDVARCRAEIAHALGDAGLEPRLFNGGGTGSLRSSSLDTTLTEIAVGSGFLASHLFDHYRDVPLVPAAFFALEVVRKPRAGIVTCQGGGYIASGEAGPSRLPVPAWPEGLSLTTLEGAGEVQTPLRVPNGVDLEIGSPVFFRHAKAGELAEHFGEYLLVRGDQIVERLKTYRGLGA